MMSLAPRLARVPTSLLVCVVMFWGCDDARYRSATSTADATGDIASDAAHDMDGRDARLDSGPGDIAGDISPSDTPPDTPPNPDLGRDAGPPGGSLQFLIRNNGELPVYLAPVWRGSSHLGVSILDANREQLALNIPCTTSCDACEDIACEPPEPRVKQLLPGNSLAVGWDGFYHVGDVCESNGNRIGCSHRRAAPVGDYAVRVCFTTLLETNADFPPRRRRTDDTLSLAEPRGQECLTVPFALTEGGGEVVVEILPSPVTKEHGYCGQAWTYDRFRWSNFHGAIPPTREANSVAIPMTLAQPDPTDGCFAFGFMRAAALEDGRYVDLRSAAWIGARDCDQELYVYLVDPLVRGDWEAIIETMVNFMPPPQDFTVEACDDCGDCLDPEVRELGEACRGDCQCGGDARCIGGECTQFCRNNLNCRADQTCQPGRDQDPVPLARICRLTDANQCSNDFQCPRGEFCQTDGNAWARCLPDFDLRLIEQAGRSFHCGCDAECPGVQSCVRFDINFTEGFCAIRCADNRDCPDAWMCLPETSSGLEAICVPG